VQKHGKQTSWFRRYLDTAPLNAWQDNRVRLERLWRGDVPDHPVVTVRYPLPNIVLLPEGTLGTAQKDFAQQVLNSFRVDADATEEGFDNVPVLSPMAPASGAGTHLLAAIAGAPIKIQQVGNANWGAWAEPIIREPADIFKLSIPDLSINPWSSPIFERARALRDMAQGVFPIATPLAGSPLDAAADLMGTESLMLTFHDCPDAVHTLLGLLTDINIEFCKQLRDAAGDWCGYAGARGGPPYVHDLLTMFLSDQLQEEFILPLYQRMGRELGGLAFGFNGRSRQTLDRFIGIENFAGLWSPLHAFAYDEIADALAGRGVWMFYSWTPEAVHKYLPGKEYAAHLARWHGCIGQMVNVHISAAMCDNNDLRGTALRDARLLMGGEHT
jgi:hypothetical protein